MMKSKNKSKNIWQKVEISLPLQRQTNKKYITVSVLSSTLFAFAIMLGTFLLRPAMSVLNCAVDVVRLSVMVCKIGRAHV